jgi:hypothetical protein
MRVSCGQYHTGLPLDIAFNALVSTDHPLAIEPRNGITYARVQELAALTAH